MGTLMGRMNRQEPGHALDHHGTDVGHALADEGNAPDGTASERRDAERLRAHPFGARARLARAAAAQQQPVAPIAG